jgi:hypothetical protein
MSEAFKRPKVPWREYFGSECSTLIWAKNDKDPSIQEIVSGDSLANQDKYVQWVPPDNYLPDPLQLEHIKFRVSASLTCFPL